MQTNLLLSTRDSLARAWAEFMTVEPNVRVDVTLKQCIGNTAIATPRRRTTSLLTYGPPELVPVFDPEANQTILMRRERLANISEPAIVRTPPRRIPLAHAATFAPFLY